MVGQVMRTVDNVPLSSVHASRSKQARAEPISLLAEQGKIHHVGNLDKLENELCLWEPGSGESPNRLDAFVWAITYLKKGSHGKVKVYN